jgi:hypothetical protein
VSSDAGKRLEASNSNSDERDLSPQRTGSRRNEVKDEDANLVCVGVVDSVDAAVHPIPAQTKKHAHKDCTEFPLGDRPSDTRPMGDCPASREILGKPISHGG